MSDSLSNEKEFPRPWWVRICRWLSARSGFVWGTVLFGVALNIFAAWLITPGGVTFSGTPLGVILGHPILSVSMGIGLVFLTVLVGLVSGLDARRSRVSTIPTQNRTRFLARLYTFYREAQNQSLQEAALIALGLRTRPDALIHPAYRVFRHLNQSEQVLPSGTTIIQVYDEAGGELLILGEPGAGKVRCVAA